MADCLLAALASNHLRVESNVLRGIWIVIDVVPDTPYARDGLEFIYPGAWQLSECEGGTERSVTIDASETLSWSVTLFEDSSVGDVLDAAVAAYVDEYPDAEVTELTGRLGQREAAGYQVDFLCLDLVATVTLQAASWNGQTVLVLTQGLDLELEEHQQALRAMTDSIRTDGLALNDR